MGAVYEGRHSGTGRRVAIKVITGDLGRDPELVARFELEARAAGAIESEHIAQVLDVGVDPGSGAPFLVMEFLVGEDLDRTFERLGALTPDVAVRIGVQACIGLGMAHAQGIVHRDIKPANLFLAERDGGEIRVKVVDFGIAKVEGNALDIQTAQKGPLTRLGTFLGSPLYMSPEQTRGSAGALDHRTDLWSLGIVLYQALAGRTPFHDVSSLGDFVVAVRTQPVPPIQAFAPWIDPTLARVVERALLIDREGRYQSAAEMRTALEVFLSQGHSLRASMLVSARPGGVTTVPSANVYPSSVGMTAATQAATPAWQASTPGQPITGSQGRPSYASTPAPPFAGAPTPPYATPAPPFAGAPTPPYATPAPPYATPAPPPYTGTPPYGAPAQQMPYGRPPGPPLPPMAPPAQKSSGSGGIIAALLALVLLGGGVGGAFALGWIGKKKDPPPAPTEAPSASAPPVDSAAVAAALTPLVGTWKSDSGVVYDAVQNGNAVEMRIRDVEPLASQGYVAGDTHFALRVMRGDPSAYRVSARIRPYPPRGTAYDRARARTTCENTWSQIGGKQLRAELSGDRLVVRMPRVDAPESIFVREGLKVVGCKGLAEAPAVEIEVVLTNNPAATTPTKPPPVQWPRDAGAPTDAGAPRDAGAPPPVFDAGGPPPVFDAGRPPSVIDAGGAPGGVGSPCQRDGHCSTRNCTSRRCQDNSPGARCIHNGHCASRKCITGTCM